MVLMVLLLLYACVALYLNEGFAFQTPSAPPEVSARLTRLEWTLTAQRQRWELVRYDSTRTPPPSDAMNVAINPANGAYSYQRYDWADVAPDASRPDRERWTGVNVDRVSWTDVRRTLSAGERFITIRFNAVARLLPADTPAIASDTNAASAPTTEEEDVPDDDEVDVNAAAKSGVEPLDLPVGLYAFDVLRPKLNSGVVTLRAGLLDVGAEGRALIDQRIKDNAEAFVLPVELRSLPRNAAPIDDD